MEQVEIMISDFIFGDVERSVPSDEGGGFARSERRKICKTYVDTLIRVSPDIKLAKAKIPEARRDKPTIAFLEYELISGAPYGLTQQEVQFAVHLRRIDLPHEELTALSGELRREFFARPRACMRTSPLPRSHGFGLHFDHEGKVALIPMESEDYLRLSRDKSITQTHAMRSRRD